MQEKIRKIVSHRDAKYQRIDLGGGVILSGADRRPTANLIFPPKMKNLTSVLDLGCHAGFFCLEAKRRGAGYVVGVDGIMSKVDLARQIADVCGQRITYCHHDVELWNTGEVFDYVLLLNVIHHLADPIRMLRRMCAISRGRVIVEFPDITSPELNVDKKIARMANKYPFIAINNEGPKEKKHQSYRYLISPSAMKRIACNQLCCKDVKIMKSPFKTCRHIAVLRP
jgi:2-polyprenyl-3-methyl-5-hydroxy-6-metoxy-1,4-benzoquinol methylase